ncbi:MAG TPA: ATP-binding cassette domain-containing protein, partial [Polyangiaceae bacterium]|nr:ATP-binding cassette domain-containing protein [Polyangiaceae bacterium]
MPSIDRKNTKPRDDHLVVRNVIKRFGDVVVLDDVSMVIRRGQTAVIIGGSGAGKTTLLRILIGLEKPSSVSVFIDGEA